MTMPSSFLSLLSIAPASEEYRDRAQAILDRKTKPLGSLGRLESLAAQLCAIQRRIPPLTAHKRILLFAGDHGIASEGVSAYPQEVTAQMLANFVRGGAAINVLARQMDAELEVVDVGVAGPAQEGTRDHKIRLGTRNFAMEPALTSEEGAQALTVGRERAEAAVREGVHLLALGEMGIGNTASAAALLSLLTGADIRETAGRGTGLDDTQLEHKQRVLTQAIMLHKEAAETPFGALCAVGGLEIAALTGAILGAAGRQTPVVIDGFICTVAALVAARLVPASRGAMLFAHRSAERGHTLALHALEAQPLLELGMRLGEGSGAALALPLVESAARLLAEMASFDQAGVSTAL